jgi:hypothetical protein
MREARGADPPDGQLGEPCRLRDPRGAAARHDPVRPALPTGPGRVGRGACRWGAGAALPGRGAVYSRPDIARYGTYAEYARIATNATRRRCIGVKTGTLSIGTASRRRCTAGKALRARVERRGHCRSGAPPQRHHLPLPPDFRSPEPGWKSWPPFAGRAWPHRILRFSTSCVLQRTDTVHRSRARFSVKFFIDAELTSLKAPDLLSIGLVADDGRVCHVEFAADWRHFNAFVPQRVVQQLGMMPVRAATRQELGRLVGESQLALGQPSVDVVYEYHAEESHEFCSAIVMSHLRLASVRRNATDTNTHPFARELYSATHVFANNSETPIRKESRSNRWSATPWDIGRRKSRTLDRNQGVAFTWAHHEG